MSNIYLKQPEVTLICTLKFHLVLDEDTRKLEERFHFTYTVVNSDIDWFMDDFRLHVSGLYIFSRLFFFFFVVVFTMFTQYPTAVMEDLERGKLMLLDELKN